MARLAEIGDGRVDPPMSELLAGPRDSLGLEALGAPFAWLALLMLVAEVVVRRLGLRVPAVARAGGLLLDGAVRLRARVRRAERTPPARAQPAAKPQASPAEREATAPAKTDLGSVLDRARRRAEGRSGPSGD